MGGSSKLWHQPYENLGIQMHQMLGVPGLGRLLRLALTLIIHLSSAAFGSARLIGSVHLVTRHSPTALRPLIMPWLAAFDVECFS
jgi:hypothetical protein